MSLLRAIWEDRVARQVLAGGFFTAAVLLATYPVWRLFLPDADAFLALCASLLR